MYYIHSNIFDGSSGNFVALIFHCERDKKNLVLQKLDGHFLNVNESIDNLNVEQNV